MAITYRAFDPNTDHPGMVELHNQVYPEQPLTLEERLESERLVSPETRCERWVAMQGDMTLNFGMAIHVGDVPNKFFIVCWVRSKVSNRVVHSERKE